MYSSQNVWKKEENSQKNRKKWPKAKGAKMNKREVRNL